MTLSPIDIQWETFLKEKRAYENFACISNSTNFYKTVCKIFDNEAADAAATAAASGIDPDNDNDEATINTTDNELHISTITKIAYLCASPAGEQPTINLDNLFWNMELLPYTTMAPGIIKKQFKINLYNETDINALTEKCKKLAEMGHIIDDAVIKHVVDTKGSISHFRKISIGTSKKEMATKKGNGKKESATMFSNCIAVKVRFPNESAKDPIDYHEYHIKIFNTGKLEIPGVRDQQSLDIILNILIDNIKIHITPTLTYIENKNEMVMINSTFYCGFNINRDKMLPILGNKYKLGFNFDPCSYPGIKCKFYYDLNVPSDQQTGICPVGYKDDANAKTKKENICEVSFMIFRTGKVNIVGKCNEFILANCYSFVKQLLTTEFLNIVESKTIR